MQKFCQILFFKYIGNFLSVYKNNKKIQVSVYRIFVTHMSHPEKSSANESEILSVIKNP